MRPARAIVVLAAALALALAPPAAALAPGVFVDPGSPAGKAYAFPLSVLRGEGAGRAAPAGAAEPLFGVGIHRGAPAGASIRGAGRAGNSSTTGRRRGGSSHAATGSGTRAAPRRGRADVVLASLARPRTVVPEVSLIAAALLLVGAAFGAGIAAARRRN